METQERPFVYIFDPKTGLPVKIFNDLLTSNLSSLKQVSEFYIQQKGWELVHTRINEVLKNSNKPINVDTELVQPALTVIEQIIDKFCKANTLSTSIYKRDMLSNIELYANRIISEAKKVNVKPG